MKLSLNGLIGYLQGKGWKVRVNEGAESEDDTFEVLEAAPLEAEADLEEDPSDMLSAEELAVMKSLARVLAKNGKLVEAIEAGTLDTALSTVPAAAELVRNAKAQQKAEKDALVATIKANSSNIYTDEELAAMPNPILVKLNAQMNVSYAGLGSGSLQQNAEQPLLIQPGLLGMKAEVNNGS